MELLELLRHLRRKVVRLAPVGVRVVELPDVLVERGDLGLRDPRRRVLRHRRPAAVIDAAVAADLEVLRLVAVGRGRVVERVGHAHALDRALLDAVHMRRLRDAGHREHGRRDVDDVVELVRTSPCARNPGPLDDRAVPRAAPVGRDLLGPLVRGASRVRPADRVVVVRVRRAEVVDARGHGLGGLQVRGAVEEDHLVERALEGALGARPVVADDVQDERVLERPELLDGVDDAPDMVIGVLEEACVDLHLAGQDHRFGSAGTSDQAGMPSWRAVSSVSGGTTPSAF